MAIAEALHDTRSHGLILAHVGRSALREQQFAEAERCYHEATRIKEALGDKPGAAATWNRLAIVNDFAGKPAAAESWFRKAIAQRRADADALLLTENLSNLANLLRGQPGRLAEAHDLAKEALALRQTLVLGEGEIWRRYQLLADIAAQQAETSVQAAAHREKARAYRRQMRVAYRAFPGNHVSLRQFTALILAACAALARAKRRFGFALPRRPPAADPQTTAKPAEHLAALRKAGWTQMADALDSLRGGERDSEALLDGLDFEDALVLETILHGLADPASLDQLKPPP